MFKNILVPLDGSGFAEAALPLARQLAGSAHARLHLVLAHQPNVALAGVGEMIVPPVDFGEELVAEERSYLRETAALLERQGVKSLESHAVVGNPGPEICEAATRLGADLIVMATHGHGAIRRFWLGGVADYLVRHLSIPVLLVHPDTLGRAQRGSLRRILVALDLSAESEVILEPVTALAQLSQAHVTLLHVITPPRQEPAVVRPADPGPTAREAYAAEAQRRLDHVARRLRDRGLSVATRITTGVSRAGTLLATLAEARFDLIAMATHGGGMRRLILGSVADHVVRGAAKPVLVIRPQP